MGRPCQEGEHLHHLQPLLPQQPAGLSEQHVELKELAGDVAHLAELLAFSVIESVGAIDEMGPHRAAIGRDKPRYSFRQHPGLLEPSVICRIGDPASVTLVILYKP